ncbi:MAG: GGDEF domain-containing protein, partial [Solirubrobacterales bacterium]
MLPDSGRTPLSERFLKIVTGVALLILTTVGIVGVSFIPDVAPDNVNFWRLVLGVPAILLAIALAVIGPRLSSRKFQASIELMMLPILAANAVILQLTPATIAVLFNMLSIVIYAGYFLRLPALVGTVTLGVGIAVSTLFVEPASLTPHLGAYLVVYVPTFVLTAVLLHFQNGETLDALRQARRRAMEDPLTGLANLRALERGARKRLGQKSRGDRRGVTGLVLIDLDNFKTANTQHGHVGGDHALRMIAHQLKRVARKDTIVARVGGDEFAALIHADSRERVEEAGEIFRGAVRAASSIMEMTGVEIDAAVGCAVYPEDGRDLSELLDCADRAMYKAKGEKRHNIPNLEMASAERLERPAWLDAEQASAGEVETAHPSLDSVTGGS